MMNYVLNSPHEHIDLVKKAIQLWNEDDAKDLLANFCIPIIHKDFKSKWVKIEAVVVKKVAKLSLPKQSKEKILGFIKPIGLQISKWKQFLDKGCNLSVGLPSEFYWTPQGTIDKKRTAEAMIKDESIDVATRYKLACIFCLECDIPILWDKLPEDCRKSFYDQEDPMNVKQKELVVLWTYQIKGEVDKMESMIEKRMERKCSPHQYAFELAAIDGNRVATDHFLQKLTTSEKEESLVKTAAAVAKGRFFNSNERTGFLRETYSHVLCFLLSQLNEEQQLEVLKLHPFNVLTCFLDWPLQDFFMETANRVWDFHSKQGYGYFLLKIIGHITDGYKDFNYRRLFAEFWQQSPDDYKKHIFSEGLIRYILSDLLKIKDEDNIRLILQDAPLDQKKYLIYDDMGEEICKKLLNNKNQLSFLKYFIKECLPSKDEVIEFKENLKNGDVWRINTFLMSGWEYRFHCVLDDIICEFKKRKSEEGDKLGKAKKV